MSTPFYKVLVQPLGGRISSCVTDGVDITRVDSDGHGGLLEDVHDPAATFSVKRERLADGGLVLDMAAEVEGLRLGRRYTFRADRPGIAVRLAYENRSPFALSGARSRGLRCLIVPSKRQERRELYCLGRDRGAVVLSTGLAMVGLYAQSREKDSLRWLAVTDPLERRALGVALQTGGCRLLAPLRAREGGVLMGWAYPAIPPRHRLTTDLVIAPLPGFGSVGELNDRFAADCILVPAGAQARARVRIVSLQDAMEDVSVVLRGRDEAGKESSPFKTLLIDRLVAGQAHAGTATAEKGDRKLAWLLGEVYTGGRQAGRFAVPTGNATAAPPPPAEQLAPPRMEPVDGPASWGPGRPPAESLTAAISASGIVVTHFGGRLAAADAGVEMHLGTDEKRTVFLRIQALRPRQKVRVAVSGGTPPDGAGGIPPAGAYLWQVKEEEAEAVLVPLNDLALAEGEHVWIALTADAAQLKPGINAGELIVAADEALVRLPLRLQVTNVPPPRRRAWAFWYLGDDDTELTPTVMGRLAGYGVNGLVVPGRKPAPEVDALAASQMGFEVLGFSDRGGTLPPVGASAGLVLMVHPRPLWLLKSRAAAPESAVATRRNGYAPAVLCDRMAGLEKQCMPADGSVGFYLPSDGCEPGRVPDMIRSGGLKGTESILLHLDLRPADWRYAALEVRSALWAAAWQGLAGVAVTCDPPRRESGTQLVLWHVLRDACREVATWRSAALRVRELAADDTGPVRTGRLAAQFELDRIIGPEETQVLRVAEQHRRGSPVYRANLADCTAGGAEGPPAAMDAFADAYARSLATAERLYALPPPAGDAQLFWLGIPLMADGDVQWAIVAPTGEGPWKSALALAEFVRKATGKTVPVERHMPDLSRETVGQPRLIWVIGGSEKMEGLPEPVREALAVNRLAPILAIDVQESVTVAVLRDIRDLNALLRALRPTREYYAPASNVK